MPKINLKSYIIISTGDKIIMRKLLLIATLFLSFFARAQEDKIVTLTVSGTGKTLEEAKTNALRSAIEQAYGAFISSKTEILNDSIVKDEVVSVTNGNIQKYDVISQVEIPDNGYAITLKASVSIEKLTSFAQSKGVTVEFKGGMFGLKMKMQRLNEEAEVVAIKNLTSTCFDILNSALDFELKVSEPVRAQTTNNDLYAIDFLIKTKYNKNFKKFIDYFKNTIEKISLKKEEIMEYKKLNAPIFYLRIDNNDYVLRNKKSLLFLTNFFISSQIFANSFKIHCDIGINKFSYKSIYSFLGDHSSYCGVSYFYDNGELIFSPYGCGDEHTEILLNVFYLLDFEYFMRTRSLKDPIRFEYLAEKFVYLSNDFELTKNDLLYKIDNDNYVFSDNILKLDEGGLIFITSRTPPIIKFTQLYTLAAIEKINEFKIEKIDINDFLQNRNLYMYPEPKEDR